MAAEDTSTPDERDRLVAEALAHARALDAVYLPPTEVEPDRRWHGPLALVLLILAGTMVVFPPSWLAGPPPPAVSVADEMLGLRLTLELQAAHIEAFKERRQRLPEQLDELDASLPGVRYVRSGERVYQLVAYGPDRLPVVWDSARPSEEIHEPAAAALNRIDAR